MSRKTLLVLAASVYQLPVIETARRLGLRVVTTDNRPDNPGHALADASHAVDTTDADGVLEIARREHIAGIIAAGTDVAVPTAAYVAQALGLPGVPLESARTVCDKSALRAFLAQHGFPVAPGFDVRNGFEPDVSLFTGGRWVLKPTRSSGSKGVYVVGSRQEFDRRLPETLAFSSTREAVLEQYLAGSQHTCEGFLLDGAPAFFCVLDRQIVGLPFGATCGHHVPTRLDDATTKRVCALVTAVLQRLDVRDGPFDCDFVMRDGQPVILELSPRIGGNSIVRLLARAYGFDLVAHSIRAACREPVEIPAVVLQQPTAVVLLGADRAGRLAYDVDELSRLAGEPWVDSIAMDVPPGVAAQPFSDGRHRLGEALVTAASRDDLDRHVDELRRRIGIRTT